ncbi:MAG: VOC family protein [Solirubrobacterales bacterium]
MTCARKAAIIVFLCLACLAAIAAAAKSERSTSTSAVNRIRFEHVGLNVADPIKIAQWYIDNLDMKVLREGAAPANNRFVADKDGNMMFELYCNPPEAVPDYRSIDPMSLHIAFLVDDVDAVRAKLIAAGATAVGDATTNPAGDRLAMLRDPWGLPIQFIRRANPMLSHK